VKQIIEIDYLPPTLNVVIEAAKKGPIVYSKLKRQHTQKCLEYLKGKSSFPGEVWLTVEYRIQQSRDPLDNVACSLKFVLDAMVKACILKDDSARVIQSPFVPRWAIVSSATEEGLTLVISDSPLAAVVPLGVYSSSEVA
jgi:hypothetical protein